MNKLIKTITQILFKQPEETYEQRWNRLYFSK